VAIPPVKSEKLYLAVADRLKSIIRDGHYEIGAALPSERDLSHLLKVGRAPVREALIALDILGIVEHRPGQGWVVRRAPDAWLDVSAVAGRSPSDILQARLLVECAAVERVALQHDEEDLAPLRQAVEDFAAEVERGQYHGKADRQFHVLLARASGNAVLGDLVAYLWDLQDSEFFRRVEGAVGHSALRVPRYLADHRRVYTAIVEWNAPRAREVMRGHLEGVYHDLLGASDAQSGAL
jgi:DNA-binding FadR family transcriptional regulator